MATAAKKQALFADQYDRSGGWYGCCHADRLWIRDETTFNEWHSRHASLTRILSIFRFNSEVTVASVPPFQWKPGLYSRHPSAFRDLALVSEGGHVIAAGDKKLSQWGMWAQPSFPAMFSFRMVAGGVTAFKDPSSLLLSESAARALFGNADAPGQMVTVDDHVEMRVGGVFADLPQNTQFYGTAVLLPWDNKANRGTTMGDDWSDHHFELYAELADGVTARRSLVGSKTCPNYI